MANQAPTNGGQQMSPQQINKLQRDAVLSQSIEQTLSIYSNTVFPPNGNVVNIQPRNVGLVKRFVVEISGVFNNTGAGVATLTDFGLANLLSQVVFLDLNNNTRIQTTGAHLWLLAGAKRRHLYVASADYNQVSGNNRSSGMNVPPGAWGVYQAPLTIAAGNQANFRMVFEIPLAYTDDDLRGAIFANVVNSNMNLQLTLNTAAMVGAAPADTTQAVYSGSVGVFTSATINVFQIFLSQLPVGKNGTILPILDLSTVYELKNTTLSSIVPANDFPIPFTNFRDFASTFVIFNNNGTSTGRQFGNDVNYLALQSANFTNLWKVDPLYAAQLSREVFQTDLPAGCYYQSYRKKNISTTQYGNMELIINPNVATANAYANVFWEDFAIVNALTAAGSLAG